MKQCKDAIRLEEKKAGEVLKVHELVLNLHTCTNSFAMQKRAKDLNEHCNAIGFQLGHLTRSLFTFLNIYLCT